MLRLMSQEILTWKHSPNTKRGTHTAYTYMCITDPNSLFILWSCDWIGLDECCVCMLVQRCLPVLRCNQSLYRVLQNNGLHFNGFTKTRECWHHIYHLCVVTFFHRKFINDQSWSWVLLNNKKSFINKMKEKGLRVLMPPSIGSLGEFSICLHQDLWKSTHPSHLFITSVR